MHRQIIKLLILAGLFLNLATAALDPDIFDGRITETPPPPSESGEEASESGSAGETPPEAQGLCETTESGAEQRDLSEIGGVGGGQPVVEEGSKEEGSKSAQGGTEQSSESNTSTSGGGSDSTGSESGEETSSAGSDSGGGSPVEGQPPTGSGGGTASGSGSESLNFEDFGSGGASTQDKVEVNRSKSTGQYSSRPGDPNAPTSEGGTSSSSTAESSNQSTAQKQAGGGSQSETSTGGGSGDYGSNLPSGL